MWEVDPVKRAARAYTAPDRYTEVGEDGELDGGDVLPGFRVSLRQWFARAGERGPAAN